MRFTTHKKGNCIHAPQHARFFKRPCIYTVACLYCTFYPLLTLFHTHNIYIIYMQCSPVANSNSSSTYSGRKFTRLGRAVIWSLLISPAVTLHDSRVKDFRSLSGFRWCNPPFVTREFETFRETSAVSPVDNKLNSMGNN